MCGIAGVASADPGPRDPGIVSRMAGALQHRGPDDEGLVQRGDATIAARRLAIIDLSRGHQPLSNEDGTVWAVQNGELYNFAELREELEARGHRFATDSDTEVLPHGYEEWGAGIVRRLRGMFALAIWDSRAGELLLARDRFGKKPLLYAAVPGALLFGSEIQALLAHPAVPRDLDHEAIDEYLSLGYVPAPRTGFAAVRKVPPAHTLTLRAGGPPRLERYWRLEAVPKLVIGRKEAVEELRARLSEAVRLRMISDVPIGVFLSGGLDSSTVVAFMARHSAMPVRTFAIGFTERHLDELRYARLVAQAFGTEHRELVVDAGDADVLPRLLRHVGEPFADSSIVPTYHVARITSPHVKVALTGDGGDELFLGYDRYRAAAAAEHLPGRIALLGGAARRAQRALRRIPRATRALEKVVRFGEGAGLPDGARYLRWSGYFNGPLGAAIRGERLAPTGPRGADVLVEGILASLAGAPPAERYALADIELGLPGDLLAKMDIATMAASLESRAPLLDHELAEFIARLPSSYKATATASKILLRDAMKGLLPPEVLRRGKSGFVAPVGTWMRGAMGDLYQDLVPGGGAVSEGWISGEAARTLYDEHRTGAVDRTRHLFALLALELWWREVASAGPARDAEAVLPTKRCPLG